MDARLLKELNANRPEPLSQQKPFLKALIYGDWGVGKTTVACTSGRRTLLISSGDGGEFSLHDYPEYRDSISILQCQGLSHIKAVFQAISEGIEGWNTYEVVAIDTISSIADQFLKNLVDNYQVNNDRILAKPRKPGAPQMEAEGMGDYRFLTAHVRDLAPVSARAPVDVIWIAHEREPSFMDEAKGSFLTRPKLPEKAADAIAENCHLVGLMQKTRVGKEIKRTITFMGSDRTAAKSRIKSLNDMTIQADEFWKNVEEWRNK